MLPAMTFGSPYSVKIRATLVRPGWEGRSGGLPGGGNIRNSTQGESRSVGPPLGQPRMAWQLTAMNPPDDVVVFPSCSVAAVIA